MVAAAPALQQNIIVNVIRKALSDVFSQAFSAEWVVETAVGEASQFTQVPSLCFRFAISGTISGDATLEVGKADAVLLAQKFLGEAIAPSAELTQEHQEAITELLRQMAGVAESGLKAQVGEVKIQVLEVNQGVTRGTMTLMSASQGSTGPIWLALCLQQELLESMATRLATVDAKATEAKPEPSTENNLDLLLGVNLHLMLRFGQRVLTLREILDLTSGSVVELDRQVHEPADLMLGGKLVARGEVVIVDGNYGIRVTEVQDAHTTAKELGSA